MPQYRPSSLIPSTITSSYSIDASVVNMFRCKINGNSPTIKYRLKIMQNNTSSTIVYDTGVVMLPSPVYPVNYDGTQNELIIGVPSTSGMTNGNEYKWTITSYWSNTEFYESYENVFYAYSAASLSINTFPNPITSKSYTFSATYSQAQGISVEKFGWILRDVTTKIESVNTIDSNNIYSSDVKMSYDGFLSGTSEEVKVKCWLSNGIEIETNYIQFSILYTTYGVSGQIETKQTCDNGILVKWPNLSFISGTPLNNNYSFNNNLAYAIGKKYLELSSGNSVTYDQIYGQPLSISSDTTHVLCFYSDVTNQNAYVLNGTRTGGSPYFVKIEYNNGTISINVNGTVTNTYTTLGNDLFYAVIFYRNSIKVISHTGNLDGLYPSTMLYPSQTLYPKTQTYSGVLRISTSIDIPSDLVYNSLVLNGYQKTNYLWVLNGVISSDIENNLLTTNYIPVWNSQTVLLALFQDTFSAGRSDAPSNIVGWSVYKYEVGSPTLKFMKDCPSTRTFTVDYSAKNMTSVSYYVFPVFQEQIGIPVISDVIVPSWWDWSIIVCEKVGNDEYIKSSSHKFDLDVSTAAMSNNTTFSILENFTKYSKVQHSNANYWSGTITALLGNCSDNYFDTVKQMDEIKSLATDRKDKFLKDRKGNLWKVSLNSPVSEQINDIYLEQAVSVSLNWMEVGSSENSSITENPILTIDDIDIMC